MEPTIGLALLVSAIAGISTTLGSFIGIGLGKPSSRLMSLTLGFSAGAMILVSFIEILHKSIDTIGSVPSLLAFFGGMLAMFLIDAVVPHVYMAESHHVGDAEESAQEGRLMKAGLLCAVGVAIHNFPEGMATFAGTLQDLSLGMAIAVAIALHNIPEGLAISAPVYAATGSRRKAIWWAFLSGATEPIGAGLAALVLLPFLNLVVLAYVLSAVAGVMVFISLDELVPVACSFGEEHVPIIGVVAGMMVMSLSLWLL